MERTGKSGSAWGDVATILGFVGGILGLANLGWLAARAESRRPTRAVVKQWSGDRVVATYRAGGPVLAEADGDGPGRVIFREAGSGRMRVLRGVFSIGSGD